MSLLANYSVRFLGHVRMCGLTSSPSRRLNVEQTSVSGTASQPRMTLIRHANHISNVRCSGNLFYHFHVKDRPWLRRLVAGLSSRRLGFAPGSVHVEFVSLGQNYLRAFRFYSLVAAVRRHNLTPMT
jgi:hypothetical protein